MCVPLDLLHWCCWGAAEVGLDRSATIPGSRARTSLQHQMELLKMQVRAYQQSATQGQYCLAGMYSCRRRDRKAHRRVPVLPCADTMHSAVHFFG